MSQVHNKVTDMPAHMLFAVGIFLPLLFMLVSDWLHVKYSFSTLSDLTFWAIFLLLSFPCFYLGFKKFIVSSLNASLLATLACFVCAMLMIFVVLHFHMFIGGRF